MVAIIITFTVGGSVAAPLMPDLSKVRKSFTLIVNENIYQVKWGCEKGTPCHKHYLIWKRTEEIYNLNKKLVQNKSIKSKRFKKRKSGHKYF